MSLAQLALQCTCMPAALRPTMGMVVSSLETLLNDLSLSDQGEAQDAGTTPV